MLSRLRVCCKIAWPDFGRRGKTVPNFIHKVRSSNVFWKSKCLIKHPVSSVWSRISPQPRGKTHHPPVVDTRRLAGIAISSRQWPRLPSAYTRATTPGWSYLTSCRPSLRTFLRRKSPTFSCGFLHVHFPIRRILVCAPSSAALVPALSPCIMEPTVTERDSEIIAEQSLMLGQST